MSFEIGSRTKKRASITLSKPQLKVLWHSETKPRKVLDIHTLALRIRFIPYENRCIQIPLTPQFTRRAKKFMWFSARIQDSGLGKNNLLSWHKWFAEQIPLVCHNRNFDWHVSQSLQYHNSGLRLQSSTSLATAWRFDWVERNLLQWINMNTCKNGPAH